MSEFKPSPAMVVASLALFVALSGSALALRAGSVGPRAIKNEAVRTNKLKDGAVTTVKLKDGAVTSPKFAAGSVTATTIAAGAVGSSQLGDGSVLTSKIGANAVDSNQLADGAVGGRAMKANAVNANKIEDGAVTAAAVLDGSLRSADLGPVVSLPVTPPAPMPEVTCRGAQVSGPGAVAANRNLLPLSTGAGWDDRLSVAGAYGMTDGSLVITICNSDNAPIAVPPAGNVSFLQL